MGDAGGILNFREAVQFLLTIWSYTKDQYIFFEFSNNSQFHFKKVKAYKYLLL